MAWFTGKSSAEEKQLFLHITESTINQAKNMGNTSSCWSS